jgi:regulator of protease activity HflC (stomatin/prohibitin superfamily)
MFIVLGVFVVVLLMGLSYRQWFDDKSDTFNVGLFSGKLAKYTVVVMGLAIVATFAKDSLIVVPAGHRGVIFDKFSGVKPNALNEGFNVILPFVQDVTLFDIRMQKGEFTATAASKDLQSVATKVALNFRPQDNMIQEIYQKIGPAYAEKVIYPAVQEAVKATTALYTAEELITRREEVKKHIQQILQQQTAPAHILVSETYITDFDFSKEFAHAVEAKQIAEQQAFKAKRDLDRIKIEAEQKIAQARAEAQSLAMQKEAITTNLIELRRIEAQKLAIERWNGKLPDVMMGGTSTPFIDVSQFTSKR